MKRLMPLMLVLALVACSEPPAEAAPAASADPAPAPAAAPAETAAPEASPADAAPAEAAPEAAAEATEAAEAAAPEAPAAPTPPPAPVAIDPALIPREGIDFVVLPSPQPTFGQGGIEVAEVFAYTCIHCAHLQPTLNAWKAVQPADVRFVPVPGAFGGISDNFARGFYAAEAMGLLDKTHDDMFTAVLVERKFATGSVEEIADYYASQGADRAAFLSTMSSFSVNAKLNKARQFALRGNVEATPTMIIAGKYSAVANGERGAEGLMATVDWLVARERAAAAAGAASN